MTGFHGHAGTGRWFGGLIEIIYGVKAEGESLENIAKPLTAEDTPASGNRGPASAAAAA